VQDARDPRRYGRDMSRRPAVVIRNPDIRAHERVYVQRLHPGAEPFAASRLSRDGGLAQAHVSRGRIAPGKASFAYHAHLLDEEWIYILDGRAVCRIDDRDVELAPGDFVAFPPPSVAHQLRNPGDTDLVYLFGGTDVPLDILDYPDLGKRFVLEWDGKRVAFLPLGDAQYPFERIDQPRRAWQVYAANGWGSAIAEAALAIAGVPYERVVIDMSGDRAALRAVNPLAQVPAVVLPDGSVMTESAAIVMRVAELAPGSGLAPPIDAPERASFLRWLAFVVSAIYPTFTYGDYPARWAGDDGKDALRKATDEHREALWRQMEAAAQAPWFLGTRFSAIDLYIGVTHHWRPGPAWFAAHAPKLTAIAAAVARRDDLAAVWRANFA
jgi:GST-like protein